MCQNNYIFALANCLCFPVRNDYRFIAADRSHLVKFVKIITFCLQPNALNFGSRFCKSLQLSPCWDISSFPFQKRGPDRPIALKSTQHLSTSAAASSFQMSAFPEIAESFAMYEISQGHPRTFCRQCTRWCCDWSQGFKAKVGTNCEVLRFLWAGLKVAVSGGRQQTKSGICRNGESQGAGLGVSKMQFWWNPYFSCSLPPETAKSKTLKWRD